MRMIKPEPLSVEAFLPFGFYVGMTDPNTLKLGTPPIEFFRDMVQQDLGGASVVSFSTCRVEKREPIIDVSEYHSKIAEALMPLDQDVLVHVGPATAGDVPLDDMRLFSVPRCTMVVLRAGVWHHAPFVVDADAANILVVLPERAYANDCTAVESDEADRIRIEL